MIKTKSSAIMLTAVLGFGAGIAAAHSLHSSWSKKVLTDSAQALRNSDPTVASNLDEIAQRGETVTAGPAARGLSTADQDTLTRAADELKTSNPSLSRKLRRIEKVGARAAKGMRGAAGAGINPEDTMNRGQGTAPDRTGRQNQGY